MSTLVEMIGGRPVRISLLGRRTLPDGTTVRYAQCQYATEQIDSARWLAVSVDNGSWERVKGQTQWTLRMTVEGDDMHDALIDNAQWPPDMKGNS